MRARGRLKGRIGALVCELASNRALGFKTGSGFKDSQRDVSLFAAEYEGATVEIQYQELTRAGLPRFPIFKRVKQ
jgi:hypothetical protein